MNASLFVFFHLEYATAIPGIVARELHVVNVANEKAGVRWVAVIIDHNIDGVW